MLGLELIGRNGYDNVNSHERVVSMLICEKLQEFDTLSASEKAVANKILELKEAIGDMTIRDLAKASYTATSAVSRMAKKIGFESYLDFKEAFVKELNYLNTHFRDIDANVPFDKNDNLARVAGAMASMYEQTSKDTLELVDYSQLIRAIDLIERADTIHVICYGIGQNLGRVFADRMMRIGKKVVVTDNIHTQFYSAYHSDKSDCFIVISYTGTTRKIRTYIDYINQNKAKSILVTSIGENDISLKTDVVLRMSTREKLYSNIANFSSAISIMMIFDLLYSGYFQRDYDGNFAMKKQMARDYEDCRTSISVVMDEE